MKHEINYYYGIYPDKVFNMEDNYYFYMNGIKYILIYLEKNSKDFDLILTIMNEFIKRNVLIDNILLNKDNSYISNIDNKNFILLKVNESNEQKSLEEINMFDKLVKTNKKEELGYTSWDKLWSKKIDNYENKIINILNKDKLIENSFDYFIGLSENAISYVNKFINEYNKPLVIEHKRINKEINNIYNPFNLIIDYEIRDIAEYIKVKFFYDTFSFKELEDIIYKNNYDDIDISLLFGRLLFPTYYFDLLDDSFKGKNIESSLKRVIDRVDDYEKLLVEIFEFFIEKYNIPKIDWLYRKD